MSGNIFKISFHLQHVASLLMGTDKASSIFLFYNLKRKQRLREVKGHAKVAGLVRGTSRKNM